MWLSHRIRRWSLALLTVAMATWVVAVLAFDDPPLRTGHAPSASAGGPRALARPLWAGPDPDLADAALPAMLGASASVPASGLPRAPRERGAEPLWQLTRGATHGFDHPVGDLRPERHPLVLDTDRLRRLEAGDAFSLELPGMGRVVARVERVTPSESGVRGIFGVLEPGGPGHSVVLTVGKTALFGTISTPRGSYALEGVGGAAALFEDHLDELIDPSQSDQRIPPGADIEWADAPEAEEGQGALWGFPS